MTDYTKYSYSNLVSRLTDLIKSASGWGNAYISSVGQTIIQVVAYATDGLNYKLERRTQESYLPTAQLPTSIKAIASSTGYRPRRAVSANGMLSLQLVDSKGVPVAPAGKVTVPRYSQITYQNKNFVNLEDIIVLANQLSPTQQNKIIEGVLQSQTFDPTDTSSTLYQNNYILIEDYEDIEENSLLIYDSDYTYNDVTQQIGTTPAIGALSFASSIDAVYDIRITNEGMMIIFGDNTTGIKPATTVTVQWVKSSGTAVKIVNTGLLFSLPTTTLTDDLNLTPPNEYYYQLTNTTAISNALDAETADHIRIASPDYVRSADRAVINVDYEHWVKRSGIGGIVDSRVYGQQEAGVDPYTANNVYVVYLTEDGTALSTSDAISLRSYLRAYNFLTAHMVLMQAEVIPVQVTFKIQRNAQLSMPNSQLYDIMKNAIASFFTFQEGSLGNQLYLSTMIAYFKDYETIVNGRSIKIADYVTIDMKALKAFSAPLSTQSIDVPVTLGTVGDTYYLAINGNQYQYDQGAGDTAADVATNLAALVDADASVTATANAGTITIATSIANTPFTITNTGSTNAANLPINLTIQLPPSVLDNSDGNNLFLPGSIEIIDTSGAVLYTDDGHGAIDNGTVDYVTGEVIIPMPNNGSYYVRYKQNSDENLLANPQVALSLSPFKNAYTDASELLSTITISDAS